ncbi:MAG: replication initiation protein, partial [Pseudomonadota bacterium]
AYYESFKHLNAKVIKPAVAEVNGTSNIKLTPETRKQGRQVAEIRFLIAENPQLSMLDLDDGDGTRNSQVYTQLRALGVADRLARQWIVEHGEDVVARRIADVERRDGIRSPARYLSAAMRDGWEEDAPAVPDPEAVAKVAAAQVEAEARSAAERAREAAIETERKGRAARLDRVLAAVESRSPVQRDAVAKLFLSRIEGDLEREDFRRFGWRSGINARAIFGFWEEMEPEIFEDLVS